MYTSYVYMKRELGRFVIKLYKFYLFHKRYDIEIFFAKKFFTLRSRKGFLYQGNK